MCLFGVRKMAYEFIASIDSKNGPPEIKGLEKLTTVKMAQKVKAETF